MFCCNIFLLLIEGYLGSAIRGSLRLKVANCLIFSNEFLAVYLYIASTTGRPSYIAGGITNHRCSTVRRWKVRFL
jgi:hypothetical protein